MARLSPGSPAAGSAEGPLAKAEGSPPEDAGAGVEGPGADAGARGNEAKVWAGVGSEAATTEASATRGVPR